MNQSAIKKAMDTRTMVRVSILGLLGYILLLLNLPLPIFPTFIKLDIANLPSILAAVTMGPAAGVMVEFIKNLLKGLLASKTIGIGEISNFICGAALTIPLGVIYKKMPNIKGYILGGITGIACLSVVACLSNYFVIIPAYAIAFGGMEAIIGLCQKVNPNITDFRTVIVFAILPFNLLKGSVNVILGSILYKFSRPLFEMHE